MNVTGSQPSQQETRPEGSQKVDIGEGLVREIDKKKKKNHRLDRMERYFRTGNE